MNVLDAKRWVAALLIALLASIRFFFRMSVSLLLYASLFAAVAACLQQIGAFEIPYLSRYLSKISIDAAVTLLGILLATMSAIRIWRIQKRDEILLKSLLEIRVFFEQASKSTQELNSYLSQLRDLQQELKKGPYNLPAYWRATYLHDTASAARDSQSRLRRMAVDIYTVDSRNIHAMTSNLLMFRNFNIAKKCLLEFSNTLGFLIPTSNAGDTEGFITRLRRTPDNEYVAFLSEFGRLNLRMAGAVGGIQGNVQARFFPPSFTFAWAVLRSNKDT